MTETDMPGASRPDGPYLRIPDDVAGQLVMLGLDPAAIPALLDFDRANFRWRRQTVRGDMLKAILRERRLGLDVTQFQGLTAVVRIQCGAGRPAAGATVGLVAEEMGVDPSRASRIVGELVARGFLRREAAQDDARRSVLTLTEAGRGELDAFQTAKWQMLARVLRDWPAGQIAEFARMINRFTGGVQDVLDEMAAPAPDPAETPRD